MIRPSIETAWRIRVVLCWVKWLLIVALVLTIIIAFLLISIVMTITGQQPVEGDTYSTPGGNFILIIVIAITVLVARSSKRRQEQTSQRSDESNI